MHDLLYLLSLTPMKMPGPLLGYLSTINEVAVLSRYPADLISYGGNLYIRSIKYYDKAGEGTVAMDNVGIQEIVNFFHDYLKKAGIVDATVRIFGSYAWGTPHEESDVDVAIISKSFAEKGPFERAAMISGLHIDAVARFRKPFDIVTFSPSEYESEQSPMRVSCVRPKHINKP